MSAVSYLRSEAQFLCSICLDVFTDPVSTPCGHNFCKNCITQHWDMSQRCQCPMCKETFCTRPQLRVNTLISEIVAQFRRKAQQKASSSSSEQQAAKPGEVPCDICTGTRLKAPKSCLVCLTSYCQTHLEPHLTASRLKRHQLVEPVENLEDKMCTKHDKHLELLCKTDQTCVCVLCSVLDHKNHEFVPLREEYEGKKEELMKTDSEVEQLSCSEDHLHPLQGLSLLKSVAQVKEPLRRDMKKKLLEAELKSVQQYAVNVSLDPDTANSWLVLSDDGKQVYHSDVKKTLPDNLERFSPCIMVLGKQSFSSGFYFEVQVKGKTEWDLGVARESIKKKGQLILCPQNGFWTLWLRNGNEYRALIGSPLPLSLQPGPEKVGMFVDYKEGLVSFYDVDAGTLIYSFTGCSFTEKLYPYFSPGLHHDGRNSAPLIICPVNRTH
ncbi:E3 ubiquitin-protein ligase TRIM21-like [Pelmatolapia mariae]|uniref:E3 ubiquitin-protein ligase TRIM21-like n=1 Tax=Pelmatolapia mariae TaxID=158779 RepID=UPI002FE585E2